MLNKDVFEKITQHFQFYPKKDFFASILKKQLPIFVSYKSDPEATYVSASSLERKTDFYAFPPFCLIGRIIQKILVEASGRILVVPGRPALP